MRNELVSATTKEKEILRLKEENAQLALFSPLPSPAPASAPVSSPVPAPVLAAAQGHQPASAQSQSTLTEEHTSPEIPREPAPQPPKDVPPQPHAQSHPRVQPQLPPPVDQAAQEMQAAVGEEPQQPQEHQQQRQSPAQAGGAPLQAPWIQQDLSHSLEQPPQPAVWSYQQHAEELQKQPSARASAQPAIAGNLRARIVPMRRPSRGLPGKESSPAPVAAAHWENIASSPKPAAQKQLPFASPMQLPISPIAAALGESPVPPPPAAAIAAAAQARAAAERMSISPQNRRQ